MSSFTGPLDTRRINGHVVLLQDFTFWWEISYGWGVKKRHEVTVPKGFVCDGASVPYRLRWLAGHPFGELLRSAVVHDWIYHVHQDNDGESLSQREADYAFRKAMTVEGIGWFRKPLVWATVRLFGFRAYRESFKHTGRIIEV